MTEREPEDPRAAALWTTDRCLEHKGGAILRTVHNALRRYGYRGTWHDADDSTLYHALRHYLRNDPETPYVQERTKPPSGHERRKAGKP